MRSLWVTLLLLIAVPLHGWAAAAMAAQAGAGGIDVAMVGEPPCHAGLGSSRDVDDLADPVAVANGCDACQLCHAWQAVPAAGIFVPASAASAGPPLTHSRDTGRLMPAGLERPPRR